MQRSVRLINRFGLHARPISQIVEIAGRHQAALTVQLGDRHADARSIFELMSLGAGFGADLVLDADGPDAGELLDEIEDLVRAGFGEK